jgi:hypothetical protein
MIDFGERLFLTMTENELLTWSLMFVEHKVRWLFYKQEKSVIDFVGQFINPKARIRAYFCVESNYFLKSLIYALLEQKEHNYIRQNLEAIRDFSGADIIDVIDEVVNYFVKEDMREKTRDYLISLFK